MSYSVIFIHSVQRGVFMCEMAWQVWNMSDDCLGWYTVCRRTADRAADADGLRFVKPNGALLDR
jgi:hypothetical protein